MAHCTVTLYDDQNNVLDQRTFDASYEAGAILSVTDSIKMRVSDSEGNISSLVVESTGIKTRVSTAEGNISTLQQTATSLTSRIGTAEGNISTLQQTATSLTSRIGTAEGNISSLEQTATSLTSRISSAEGSITTLNQSASTWNVVAQQFNSDGTVKSSGSVQLAINNSLSTFSVDADQIDFKTGNFYIRNGSGTTTFHVDSAGNVEFAGEIHGGTISDSVAIGSGTKKMFIEPTSTGARLVGKDGDTEQLVLGFNQWTSGGGYIPSLKLVTSNTVLWCMTTTSDARLILRHSSSPWVDFEVISSGSKGYVEMSASTWPSESNLSALSSGTVYRRSDGVLMAK
jgi:hypothetical protein